MATATEPGTLFLIPTPLFDDAVLESLPPVTVRQLAGLQVFGVETPKVARRWIVAARKAQGIWDGSLETTQLLPVQEPDARRELLAALRGGQNVGLVSDAGCPAVADPGAILVAQAHAAGIGVVPLPGPNSVIMALMTSGFNGQQFAFHGYLPVKPPERRAALKRLETEVRRTGATQLFIETPHRNAALVADCLATLAPDTPLCVAMNIGSPTQWVVCQPIARWKTKTPDLGKEPALFAIGQFVA